MTYKEKASRNERMLALRDSGMTYQQIADEIGISRQRVYQLIGGQRLKRNAPIKEDECVYPGLRKWLLDNKLNRMSFTRFLYSGKLNPDSYQRVSRCLKGTDCRKSFIDKVLKITGLTYEQAFGGADND